MTCDIVILTSCAVKKYLMDYKYTFKIFISGLNSIFKVKTAVESVVLAVHLLSSDL